MTLVMLSIPPTTILTTYHYVSIMIIIYNGEMILSKQKTVRYLILLNTFLHLGAKVSTRFGLPEFVSVAVN